MERRRAWITASAVTVTFATAALAVMANTGLLSSARSERKVGRLTPTQVDLQSEPATTAGAVKPVVVVRYEDVYVTDPQVPDAASANSTTSAKSAKSTKGTRPPARATSPTSHAGSPDGAGHETGEARDSDDD